MSVTITAKQAQPGDVVRDRHGNLFSRQTDHYGNFTLVYMFTMVLDYGTVETNDEGTELTPEQLDLFGPLELMMRGGQPVGDELPAPPPPRVVEFEWGFHSNLWENRDSLARELGFTPTDELIEKMGNPFYEVIVRFSVDTVTGETKVLGAK